MELTGQGNDSATSKIQDSKRIRPDIINLFANSDGSQSLYQMIDVTLDDGIQYFFFGNCTGTTLVPMSLVSDYVFIISVKHAK